MADFSWGDIGSNLLNSGVDSVSRRIDNELNSDFLPSPSQATGEAPVVKTAENELGRAKFAGTGGSMVDCVPSAFCFGGGVVVLGLVAILALK